MKNKQKQTNRWAPLPFIDCEPEGHHNVISVRSAVDSQFCSMKVLWTQSGSNALAIFHLHTSTIKRQVMFVLIYNACKCWSYQIILIICSKTWWAAYRGSILRHTPNVKANISLFYLILA